MNCIYIANWKDQTDYNHAKNFIENFQYFNQSANVIIAPPVPYMHLFKDMKNISLCAQNIDLLLDKPVTGNITINHLKDFNVKYAIVGHNERAESDAIVSKKARVLIENGITPIICFNASNVDNVKYSFTRFIALPSQSKVIIAYEPSDMIGSSNSEIDLENLFNIYNEVKKYIEVRYSGHVQCKVIYGGSVDESNINGVIHNCDGVIVGRSSISIDKFRNIIDS